MENIKHSQIVITWHGTEYTLEFSRETASIAENTFDIAITDLQRGKFSKVPEFFYCAFIMHHSKIEISTTNAIWRDCEDKTGLLTTLIELYYNTVNSLFDGNTEEGNAAGWKAL